MTEIHHITKEWHKNGQLEYEVPFALGEVRHGRQKFVQHGIQKCYYDTGVLKEEIPYVRGFIHGTMIGYFPDGRIRYRYEYENHKLIKREDFNA